MDHTAAHEHYCDDCCRYRVLHRGYGDGCALRDGCPECGALLVRVTNGTARMDAAFTSV